MKIAFGLAFFLTTAVSLLGCATATTFRTSKAARPAVLEASWERHAITVWKGVDVISIDGKFVRVGMLSNPSKASFKLDPGNHRVVANVRFNQGSGMFEGKATLQADFPEAATYRLVGEIADAEVHIWLVDTTTGKTVSDVARAPFVKSAPVIGIPIII